MTKDRQPGTRKAGTPATTRGRRRSAEPKGEVPAKRRPTRRAASVRVGEAAGTDGERPACPAPSPAAAEPPAASPDPARTPLPRAVRPEVLLLTFGCRAQQADEESLRGALLARGMPVLDDRRAGEAGIAVV
ncbi:MAG: hypothetical protein JXB32_08100, partial [Deltaproteobacteria bacterium]|nr:hypothetical protein [Deltaproteobacteria bacterium]